MSRATYPLVRDLITSLTAEDWQGILWSNLHGLKSLHSIPLDFVFLKAAAHFWDVRDHVFRFQGLEICPLLEELAAILGASFQSTTPLALPGSSTSYATQLTQVFHFNHEEASLFLSAPSRVPLPLLLELVGRRASSTLSRSRLTVLVLLAQFLLTNLEGTFDCALLNVVENMEQGRDFFPTILAETLLGLDRVSSKTSSRMSGSPLLLQVFFAQAAFSGFQL